MKRLMTTTALMMLTATATFAATGTELREAVTQSLGIYQTDINVDALTDAQVSALYTALNSGNSPAEINAQISSIAGTAQSDDATQLRAALANALEMYQVDATVADLTDVQVVGLTLVINSGGSNAEKKGQMDAIIMAR